MGSRRAVAHGVEATSYARRVRPLLLMGDLSTTPGLSLLLRLRRRYDDRPMAVTVADALTQVP